MAAGPAFEVSAEQTSFKDDLDSRNYFVEGMSVVALKLAASQIKKDHELLAKSGIVGNARRSDHAAQQACACHCQAAKVASEKKQRLERQACIRRKRRAAIFQGGNESTSRRTPYRRSLHFVINRYNVT